MQLITGDTEIDRDFARQVKSQAAAPGVCVGAEHYVSPGSDFDAVTSKIASNPQAKVRARSQSSKV